MNTNDMIIFDSKIQRLKERKTETLLEDRFWLEVELWISRSKYWRISEKKLGINFRRQFVE